MKKINLLLLATLLAGSLAAQTTVFHWQMSGTSAPVAGTALTATGGTIMPGTTDSGKSFTVESVAYVTGTPADMQALNGKGVKFGANALFFTLNPADGVTFQAGDTIMICGYLPWKVSSSSEQTGDLTSNIETGADKNSYTVGKAVLATDAEVIYLSRAKGSSTAISAIKIVRPAPKTEPWLTLSATKVELAVTPFAASDEAKVTLKGGNLTAGNYTLTVPNVAGLTVEPASVTVAADGTVNQDITLTYASTVDVPEATAKVSVTIDKLPAELTITYSAHPTAYTQTTVSDSTTWDWTKAGIAEIKLDSTSTPSLLDTIILANVQGIYNGADFRSDALEVCGQYLVRDGKFFQGGYISFNAERKGFVTVNYSNTAGNAARSLVVNGTKDAAVSSADTKTVQTSSKMSVNAGKVVIMFAETADNTNETKYARVYSITYVPEETGTALEQNSLFVPATKVIRNGQLLIIREGKTYTVQGVEVK